MSIIFQRYVPDVEKLNVSNNEVGLGLDNDSSSSSSCSINSIDREHSLSITHGIQVCYLLHSLLSFQPYIYMYHTLLTHSLTHSHMHMHSFTHSLPSLSPMSIPFTLLFQFVESIKWLHLGFNRLTCVPVFGSRAKYNLTTVILRNNMLRDIEGEHRLVVCAPALWYVHLPYGMCICLMVCAFTSQYVYPMYCSTVEPFN